MFDAVGTVLACVAFLAVASAQVQVVQKPSLIVKQSQDLSPDGSYSYSYETDNGIYHGATGTRVATNAKNTPVIVTQGQYQYTAPDGTPIQVTYTADQNGFQPQGAHIPQVPALINKALEYIRSHPQPEHSDVN
ncbi:larval cuticle protein LCP-17-like [Ceratina calcarata]|uniref:Larval cuticle protein LCP-17-like n=1 Tax=Ceratina calcarata TaxID=156304 RepID=A0AAJ7J7U6_9HYME|nr:larval cuticle protein LCP-17-like [Ceratina calcarata]